jgi:pimeloyl-ACP methyl ester carboxylesterase
MRTGRTTLQTVDMVIDSDAAVMRASWSEVQGARMYSVALGLGPPVVLVHGYGVSGAYMLPLARALAPSCEAFVPDLPGQGKSESLCDRIGGIADLAEALGAWVAANGLTRPVFVANSMGCQIVTDLAVRRPDHVGPMVLVGPTVDPERRTARHQLFGMLRETAREPLSLVALAARDDAAAGIRTLLSTARAVLADRIEDRLPLIEQPTVVVHGEKDGFVSRDWVERAAGLLPRGRLVLVPGEPHAVNYTRPDLIARIVQELLVEEGEHAGGELVRRLQHGDVSARKLSEPRVGQHPMPLVGDSGRDESVAVAPHE